MVNLETRERKVRYHLQKHGFRLHKTPAQSWLRGFYEVGYMISQDNTVILGCFEREYQSSIEDIESFIENANLAA